MYLFHSFNVAFAEMTNLIGLCDFAKALDITWTYVQYSQGGNDVLGHSSFDSYPQSRSSKKRALMCFVAYLVT